MACTDLLYLNLSGQASNLPELHGQAFKIWWLHLHIREVSFENGWTTDQQIGVYTFAELPYRAYIYINLWVTSKDITLWIHVCTPIVVYTLYKKFFQSSSTWAGAFCLIGAVLAGPIF